MDLSPLSPPCFLLHFPRSGLSFSLAPTTSRLPHPTSHRVPPADYELLDPIGSNGKIAATIAMTRQSAAQIKIGTLVVVSATVAMTAERIPMILFKPIAMPLPVPRWAEGRTSGV